MHTAAITYSGSSSDRKGACSLAQLPIYIINLDRRVDRWQVISEDIERLGLTATRIPGVEAATLAEFVEQERKSGKPLTLPSINLGSAACMIGHTKALKSLLKSEFPAALILEDDAELALETPSLMQSADWWPDGSLLIRLEDGRRHRRLLRRVCGKTPSGRDLRRLEKFSPGSAAYLVNREGARLLLEAFKTPTETVDHTIFDLQVSRTARRLQTCQIVPATARQRRDGNSDIVGWRPEQKLRGLEQQKYRIGLLWARLPHKISLLGPRLTGEVRKTLVPYSDTP